MKMKRYSLAQQAYGELLRRIIGGALAVGEKLTEDAISEEFGISRTPAREALTLLERDGLVERQRRCGWRVSSLSQEQVRELFECRSMLECLALKSAIYNIPPERIEQLIDALQDTGDGARQRSLEVDEELHTLLSEYCDNSYLASMLERLRQQSAPFRFYRNEQAQERAVTGERLELLEAMHRQDIAVSAELLAAHIMHGCKIFEQETS